MRSLLFLLLLLLLPCRRSVLGRPSSVAETTAELVAVVVVVDLQLLSSKLKLKKEWVGRWRRRVDLQRNLLDEIDLELEEDEERRVLKEQHESEERRWDHVDVDEVEELCWKEH